MAEWDRATVYSAPQFLGAARDDADLFTADKAFKASRDFILTFQRDSIFPYREALLQNFRNRQYHVELDLGDLQEYNPKLHDAVTKRPNEFIPLMEKGASLALKTLAAGADDDMIQGVQVLLIGDLAPTQIRAISAVDVNRLLLVPGIVINASRTKPRATVLTARCKNCGTEREIAVPAGFGGVALPRTCPALQMGADGGGNEPPPRDVDGKCPLDPYVITTDKCTFVDQQTLKLQEAPEAVPTGEMPRHLLLAVERSLADRIAPGTRVSVLGVASIFSSAEARGGRGAPGAVAVRTPYLRVVGVIVHEEGSGRALTIFTREEEARLAALAKEPNVFQRLADSIAPSISGDYTADIKKAILCLLLAGSRKLLPDGMRLRGDINVLLLGDPSTAKSQFLKFVEKVAPVGVYTSGKGSSAAGLTASVIRDAKGEFFLEGGAMVLADGGVVCIDEFDKMREEDRVAIHEAMEQQTISVAKAGITTILNSRSAVLAAANPVFGRYDDNRSAADNIDLLPTILSRFDLIFIVRDLRDEARDKDIARHVLGVHVNYTAGPAGIGGAATGTSSGTSAADFDLPTMKKYIAYARGKCAPRLTADAAAALAAEYVEIRQGSRKTEAQAREARLAGTEEHGVIPITVRQLEALVRITEAVAKASLSASATAEHVKEAVRLFRVSTLAAAASGLSSLDENMSPDLRDKVIQIEKRIARMVPVNGSTSTALVKSNLMRSGFNEGEVGAAIRIMERRGELALVSERKTLRRIK